MKRFNDNLLFWVFLLISISSQAALTKPTLVYPANNANNLPTGIQLNLKNSNGTSYIFEYATSSNMANATRIDVAKASFNTRHWINKLKLNTTYYWRSKALSSSDSSDWTSIWSFTTANQLQKYYPSSTGATFTNSKIYLSCYRAQPYDSFELQLDTQSSFSSAVLRKVIIPDTFKSNYIEYFHQDLFYGANYYWRYRGIQSGTPGSWTSVGDFSIFDSFVTQYPKPSVLENVSIEFEWQSGSSTEPFQVQVDTVPSFDSPILIDQVSIDGLRKFDVNPFKVTQLLYETQYYYRVRAVNKNDSSKWSSSSFITKGFANDFTTTDAYVDPIADFSVRTKIEGSTGYEIQIDISDSFNSIAFNSNQSSDGNATFSQLQFGAYYFVRSRPYHAKDTGNWTKVRTMRVLPFPSTYYPYNNWTDIGLRDSLVFSTRRGIDGFQMQISTETDFSNTLFLDTTLLQFPIFQDPNIKTKTFKFNQNYYWRMRCWHAKDTSVWGTPKKFTTQVAPKLTLPYDSRLLGTNPSTSLVWEPIKSIKQYQVVFDTSSKLNSSMRLDTLISEASQLDLKELLFGQSYYWKVRALSPTDTSAWSDTWQFTIYTPRLNSPSNNITNLSLTSLDWASIQGTSGYILELDSNPSFTSPVRIFEKDSNAFFYYFTTLPELITFNIKYYWRVKLFHAKDTSDWSSVWNFTTKPRRAPTLSLPLDSSLQIPLQVTMVWNAYSGAASYALEYSESKDIQNAQKLSVGGTSKSVLLKPKTTYYWHVRCKNSNNQEFYDWSETWQFTTVDGLLAPQLLKPANQSTELSNSVQLTWETIPSASGYNIELSSSPDFIGVFKRTANQNTYIFSDLAYNATYYWRVKATNSVASSPWSDAWSFTTQRDQSAISQLSFNQPRIYPSPAQEQLTIDCKNTTYKPLFIYNAVGRMVQEFEHSQKGTRADVNVSSWTPGSYLIILSNGKDIIRKMIQVN